MLRAIAVRSAIIDGPSAAVGKDHVVSGISNYICSSRRGLPALHPVGGNGRAARSHEVDVKWRLIAIVAEDVQACAFGTRRTGNERNGKNGASAGAGHRRRWSGGDLELIRLESGDGDTQARENPIPIVTDGKSPLRAAPDWRVAKIHSGRAIREIRACRLFQRDLRRNKCKATQIKNVRGPRPG